MHSSLRFCLFTTAVLSAALGSIAACSSSDGAASTSIAPDTGTVNVAPEAGADAAHDAASDASPKVTPPTLPIIPNQGGPILASPEIVTVTWTGDPIASDLEAFDAWWAASATWKSIMAEWGVGPGKYVSAVRLTTPAPALLADADVATLLLDAFAAGTLPAPNGSRIYMIYPPSGTVVTNFGAQGCSGFQAYHFAVDVPAGDAGPAAKAIFAVTPRCADTSGFTATDFTTWGASHEAMEAASDPFYDHPAWRIDTQSLATPELGENADLCAGQPVKIEGHLITRNWSNVAAKAGQRPCIPAPPGPMFGLFADPGEVTLVPGKPTTVTVHAYTAGPYAPFDVFAYTGDPTLPATLSAKKAADGDVLTLTVTPSASWTEQVGQNVVYLYAQGTDYLTKRHLIVHAKP